MTSNPFDNGGTPPREYGAPAAINSGQSGVQPELVVDKILRTSYEVVKYVAGHMETLLAIKANEDNIELLSANMENIISVTENITAITSVANNILSIARVDEALPELMQVYDRLDELLMIVPSTEDAARRAEEARIACEEIQATLLADINATVEALPNGESPTVTYLANTKTLAFGLPAGDTGYNGWVANLSNVIDGERVVQRIVDWTGGSGPKPATGLYISPTGLTNNIALATNVRGASGSGTGDMKAAEYDPQGIVGDVFDRGNHTGEQPISTISGLQDEIDSLEAAFQLAERLVNKGAANGYASLDINGKVPLSQINEALIGAMSYKGLWDAALNVPVIPAAQAANKGWYYVVQVSGSTNIDGNSDWSVGDWIVSNGVTWDKIDSSDQVNSVNGKTGVITLTKTDIGLSNVDNTSDNNKPVSIAQQAALNGKIAGPATSIAGGLVQFTDTTGDNVGPATIGSFAILGRVTAGVGDIERLSPAQARQVLGGWEFIGTFNMAGLAVVDVVGLGAFRTLRLTASAIFNANSAGNIRFSSDNGTTFGADADEFRYTNLNGRRDTATNQNFIEASDEPVAGSPFLYHSGGTGWMTAGEMIIMEFNQPRNTPTSNMAYLHATGNRYQRTVGSSHKRGVALNALRFYIEISTIQAGTLHVEGIRS